MMKALILYYLNIKSTHGYEIQKFIQVNHMDQWTKIQSGSIYYALSKLEKEGSIALTDEVHIGAKVRKIYSITQKGKEELVKLVQTEIRTPINEVGSDKFILYPIFAVADIEDLKKELNLQIKKLTEQKDVIELWKKVKVTEHTLEVEKISFDMMISQLDYHIKWHEALKSDLNRCFDASKEITEIIKNFDFSNTDITSPYEYKNMDEWKEKVLKLN